MIKFLKYWIPYHLGSSLILLFLGEFLSRDSIVQEIGLIAYNEGLSEARWTTFIELFVAIVPLGTAFVFVFFIIAGMPMMLANWRG